MATPGLVSATTWNHVDSSHSTPFETASESLGSAVTIFLEWRNEIDVYGAPSTQTATKVILANLDLDLASKVAAGMIKTARSGSDSVPRN